MDSSSWKAYGQMDPELTLLLPNLPPNKSFADYGDANALRQAVLEQFGALIASGVIMMPDWTGAKREEIQIPARDGASLRAIVYGPGTGTPGPLLVYFHGGGMVFGMAEAFEVGAKVLTEQLGCTVVSVDYRLAPESVFPTAGNDAWDSLKWVAENASKLGADPSKGFIVSGASAGGNLAAVAAHEAADAKLSPPLTGVFLCIPFLVHPDAVPEKYKPHYNSWEENKDAMILDQRGMLWFFDQYKVDPTSPLGSPLIWPSGHKSQPPTYFQICGMDPLRDEGLIYESILREECGIATKMDVYSGIPHAGMDFLPMHSVAAKALVDMKAGVEWLLSQKP